jgi:D-3-phosphoglycerate dehydrogenase
MKILVTCPPMLRQMKVLSAEFERRRWIPTTPEVVQTLSVAELAELVPAHDGWIIGDDPANAEVVRAGAAGSLRAAVKWGVGTDNVDFEAFRSAGIRVAHTPGMFGEEVADVALGYLIGLARRTFEIHTSVLNGGWLKPTGVSLAEKTVGLIGYGDIGRQLARRLNACGLRLVIYDPVVPADSDLGENAELCRWPDAIGRCDFLCFTCALTKDNFHMLDEQVLSMTRRGIRIVNVARGPLIDEVALLRYLESGHVAAVALDVFEEEPLAPDSRLRSYPQNVFGSHNASNTLEAVLRTSKVAMKLLEKQLH